MITGFTASLVLGTILCGLFVMGSAPATEGEGMVKENIYYIVREGDCLWDISKRFYDDPFLWPFVWRNNPYIANPHWIYPGDPIYLAELGARVARVGVPLTEREAPLSFVPDSVTTLVIPRIVADTALITETTPPPSGWVLASLDGRSLLAQGDELFLEIPGNQSLAVGERFQVLRNVREIRHPETRKRMGTLVRLIGYVETIGPRESGVVLARVDVANTAVLSGDMLAQGVLFPSGGVLSKPTLRSLEGFIVANLRDTQAIAQYDVCFIDRGVADGVEAGDSFRVFEPGREVRGYGEQQRVRTPDTRVGNLVVLFADKHISTALVTESAGPFQVGFPVRSWTE